MAMGIPLVTNSGVGDVAEIVQRYKSGIIIHDFADKNFSDATAELFSGNQFDAHGIRQGAIEFYSLDSAIEKYNKIYQAIFNP